MKKISHFIAFVLSGFVLAALFPMYVWAMTVAPQQPVVNFPFVVDNGNVAAVALNGTAQPLSSVVFSFSNPPAPKIVATTTANANGLFAATFDLSSLPNGTISSSAYVADNSGAVSLPAVFSMNKGATIASPVAVPAPGSFQLNLQNPHLSEDLTVLNDYLMLLQYRISALQASLQRYQQANGMPTSTIVNPPIASAPAHVIVAPNPLPSSSELGRLLGGSGSLVAPAVIPKPQAPSAAQNLGTTIKSNFVSQTLPVIMFILAIIGLIVTMIMGRNRKDDEVTVVSPNESATPPAPPAA